MNLIFSLLLPVQELIKGRDYDAGSPGIYLALGIGFLLVVGLVVVALIVVTVKLLNHLRNKKTDHNKN